MTFSVGRCSFVKAPHQVQHSGSQVTFSVAIGSDTTVDADAYNAMRQQVVGLADNEDEPIVPMTWASDSQYDGFYRVAGVTVDLGDVAHAKRYSRNCQITLERIGDFSTPLFETTVQSVVRTNAHGFTVPPSVAATLQGDIPTSFYDFRGGLGATTQISRPNEDGRSTTSGYVYTVPAPQARTQYLVAYPPAIFYNGAARVEVLYGSTWYQVVGREIPASRVWRISNGNVRLYSANGSSPGVFEVWDNAALAWESQLVVHWTDGVLGPRIGYGDGTTQAYVSIIRNTPEQVTVRCSSLSQEMTYTLQRGNMYVSASWSSKGTTKIGAGYNSVNACSSLTGGIRRTSNDAAGNRLVFSMPVAMTTDLVSGGVYPSIAATSGTVMIGVELGGSSAIAGNTAADIINQFMGATSWRQQVIPR